VLIVVTYRSDDLHRTHPLRPLLAEQLAMLSRVLELWEQVPDAAARIGADHPAVLEEAVRAAELTGEDDRGVVLAGAALREIDTAAEPVRAADAATEAAALVTLSSADPGP
jgi:hypothetical protein